MGEITGHEQVHILGQAPSQIPGVPAKAIRRNPDGSIGVDIGCMNRDEKLAFIITRWQQLERMAARHDQVLGDLVKLNYVAGAAVELLARALEVDLDQVLQLVVDEANKARIEAQALARAKQGDRFEAKSTTMILTSLLRQVGRPQATIGHAAVGAGPETRDSLSQGTPGQPAADAGSPSAALETAVSSP